MKSKERLAIKNWLFLLLILFSACNFSGARHNKYIQNTSKLVQISSSEKINGVNFVAPPIAIDSQWTKDLRGVNCNWVALVPYAFTRAGMPQVIYDYKRQYWGESLDGITANIKQAHQVGLKIMLKPQVWMQGGWIGDFDLSSESDWKIWETDYENYIMQFTDLAVAEHVEMICIGTEYRTAVKKRPAFWLKLIQEIKKTYKGKLTYCTNWDDYADVQFWKDLDFIGISGYFPLSKSETPTIAELKKAWQPVSEALTNFSAEQVKPILFTEYGYRSMNQPAWRSWEKENQEAPINNQAQANAYEALYQTLWKEPWFAGGFAWKWYSSFRRMDAFNNHDWTPQNKTAEKVMKKYYGILPETP